ncbi:TPR repeat-containing thioredoxin TTL1-like [Silene latifolia]|uniref:TPR repeat-containing thioredoxin TTL1-like n=1 Tax=Silene latifolia TaxID=37657 RepID=UPI003D772EDF
MASFMVEPEQGCGFLGGIIRCRKIRPRNSSLRSLPSNTNKKNSIQNVLKEEQGNSVSEEPKEKHETLVENSGLVSPRISSKRFSDAARNSNSTDTTTTSSSTLSGSSGNLPLVKVNKIKTTTHSNQPQNTVISRVSSGNILQLAQITSLKQQGNDNSPKKHLPTNMSTMGNILRQSNVEFRVQKMDPEELKSMGNEKFKEGRYEEALMFYDQAVALDSEMAVYRSNKSAALTALGRLLEAVVECKEAVRIDPFFRRAHYRLATLYFRLGFPEEAVKHFSYSGSITSFIDNNQANALETGLIKCRNAKERKEWNELLREAQNLLALGADSALQVYALEAEALLNLYRHDEAFSAFRRRPNFDMDSYTRLFGLESAVFIYLIEAEVYTAAGRFEDAITAAQNAAQLNPNDNNIRTTVIKTRAMSLARSKGNKLFTEQKFLEASNIYSEGLEYSSYNSILLCNRAACRAKLGQFEKALEDSTLALSLQPSYSKARLRRAYCNGELGRWEASIRDYEILIREKPGDEEVGRALFEAKIQFKKQCGEDVKDLKFRADVISVSSIECFRHLITSPGMSVVLFCNKSNQEKALPLLEQVCMRFPSINFLKVQVEDHPYLAKSEAVSYIPAFKIYKNGTRVRDVLGNNLELLENSVKLYSS